MKTKRQHWIMDYETLYTCFVAVFESHNSNEQHIFVICEFQNDILKLLEFFQQNRVKGELHISFNGLSFDSQITQYILENQFKLKQLTGKQIAFDIYQVAQDTIALSNNNGFPKWAEYKLAVKQLDLFKLNHWDSPAKKASLKWIQASMDWHNVLDMPLHHTYRIKNVTELTTIIQYCINDVQSTKQVFFKSRKEILLRAKLTKEYNINLYSASEPKISKELFLDFLSKKLKSSKYELRQLRTSRDTIVLEPIILPYIKFSVPIFTELLDTFKSLRLSAQNLKGSFKQTIEYRGIKTTFGLGGVHGAKKGVFESDDFMILMSSDIKSFYPNLAIRNKWSPAHIPAQVFCELYEWFYDERLKLPKSDIRNYTYKIILNSTYGLSNDKNSFLYDPLFTMRITVNGQLSLMMLYTMLVENIPGAVPIMQNTDGVEILIPKKYETLYLDICKKWENITNLVLEHDSYQKLIVPDVNNYIAIYQDKEVSEQEWIELKQADPYKLYKQKNGKFYVAETKCKGRFEFKDRALHKNKSFDVVTKALFHYFLYNTLPEKYIEQNNNIFDYCGQVKIKGQEWEFKEVCVENSIYIERPLQKTLRYYISKRGSKIIKYNTFSKKQIKVEAGRWMQSIFNKYEEKPFEEYGIDKAFYLTKIRKEINSLQPEIKQTKLNF